MAFIGSFSSTNRLIVGNEEYVRSFGAIQWTRCRIGIRFTIEDTGDSVNASTLLIGLCENGAGFLRPDTSGYIGAGWHNLTLTRGGSPVYYVPATNDLHVVQRVGEAITTAVATSSYYYWRLAGSGENLFFIDLVRNWTNNSVTAVYTLTDNAATPPAISQATFKQYMDLEDIVPAGYTTRSWSVTYLGSSLNALDAVSVYWGKATPVLHICELNMVIFY